MITIHKKVLEIVYEQEIEVPTDSMILSCQVQYDKICIWYRCDTDSPIKKVKIITYGTGHEIKNDNLMYVDTVQMMNGSIVWHVFEEGDVL